MTFTIDTTTDTSLLASDFAKALTANSQNWNDEGESFGVTESYAGGFELSLNGEAYAGGSYDINTEGEIHIASVGIALNGKVATFAMNEEGEFIVSISRNL